MRRSATPIFVFAAFLFASEALFVGDDVKATFELLNKSTSCPNVIKHKIVGKIDDQKFYVFHKNIVHDSVQCSGDNFMAIIQLNSGVKLASASDSFQVASVARQSVENDRLFTLLSEQAAPFLYGLETTKRTCGASVLPKNSDCFFIQPVTKLDVNGVSLMPGNQYMILQELNANAPCVYISRAYKKRNVPKESKKKSTPVATVVIETSTPEPDDALIVLPEGAQVPEKRSCFPSDSTVVLYDGRSLPISELRLGDRVHVGGNVYSEVFMFTHSDRNVVTRFMRITTTSGASITLTPGHYLYVNGRSMSARNVRIGDKLELGNSKTSAVTSVDVVVKQGVYNPHTILGNIVVDGILASTYTSAVQPCAAHSLLSPFRALFRSLGLSTTLLDAVWNALPNFAPLASAVL